MRVRFNLLQPILAPLIFLIVIGSAAYFLPFANINYRMHTIDSNSSAPINVLTDDTIQLDVMVYGICARQSKESLQQIQTKKKLLLDAGNTSDEISAETYEYSNYLQLILKTKLTRVNNFICGDNVRMKHDQQIATFVAAGLVSLLVLILAEFLSLSTIAVHTITIIQWAQKKESNNGPFEAHWSVELLAKSSSWLVLFSSFLYMALSWNARSSSYASLGSGYIIMLVTSVVTSVLIHCREDFWNCPNRLWKWREYQSIMIFRNKKQTELALNCE